MGIAGRNRGEFEVAVGACKLGFLRFVRHDVEDKAVGAAVEKSAKD